VQECTHACACMALSCFSCVYVCAYVCTHALHVIHSMCLCVSALMAIHHEGHFLQSHQDRAAHQHRHAKNVFLAVHRTLGDNAARAPGGRLPKSTCRCRSFQAAGCCACHTRLLTLTCSAHAVAHMTPCCCTHDALGVAHMAPWVLHT